MKTTVLECRPEPRECDIQKAAYFLWQELGRPEGRDLETWLTAKEMLRHRAAPAARTSLRATPPATARVVRTEISRS